MCLLILALLGPGATLVAQELSLLPDEPVVTQHTTTIRGETIRYTAEAGTLPIRENGKVMARMFYVYYERDNPSEGAARPMVFFEASHKVSGEFEGLYDRLRSPRRERRKAS